MKNITVFMLLAVLLSSPLPLLAEGPYQCTHPDGTYTLINKPLAEVPAHVMKWGLTCSENYEYPGSQVLIKNDSRFKSRTGEAIFVRGRAQFDQLDWNPQIAFYGEQSSVGRFLNMLARLVPRGLINAFDEIFQKGNKIIWSPEVARSLQTEQYQYAAFYTPASSSVQHAVPRTVSSDVWIAETLYAVPEAQRYKSRFGPTRNSILLTAVLVGGGLAVCLPDENSRGCEIGGGALFGGAQIAADYRRFEVTADIQFRLHGTFRNAATDEMVSGVGFSGDWFQALSNKGWVLWDSSASEVNWKNAAGDPLLQAMMALKADVMPKIEKVMEDNQIDVLIADIAAKPEEQRTSEERELLGMHRTNIQKREELILHKAIRRESTEGDAHERQTEEVRLIPKKPKKEKGEEETKTAQQ